MADCSLPPHGQRQLQKGDAALTEKEDLDHLAFFNGWMEILPALDQKVHKQTCCLLKCIYFIPFSKKNNGRNFLSFILGEINKAFPCSTEWTQELLCALVFRDQNKLLCLSFAGYLLLSLTDGQLIYRTAHSSFLAMMSPLTKPLS